MSVRCTVRHCLPHGYLELDATAATTTSSRIHVAQVAASLREARGSAVAIIVGRPRGGQVLSPRCMFAACSLRDCAPDEACSLRDCAPDEACSLRDCAPDEACSRQVGIPSLAPDYDAGAASEAGASSPLSVDQAVAQLSTSSYLLTYLLTCLLTLTYISRPGGRPRRPSARGERARRR